MVKAIRTSLACLFLAACSTTGPVGTRESNAMSEWKCEQSAVTRLRRSAAWSYWTDMQNHAEMEGVTIELDGPFETGTKGRTISPNMRQEWQLEDVVEGRRFRLKGFTPDRRGTLSFSWDFADEGDGTRITYRIQAQGPDVEQHREVWRGLEANAPKGLAALVEALDRLHLE